MVKVFFFIEFGTGIKYTAEPHPYANETGMFPGSFPVKGNGTTKKDGYT